MSSVANAASSLCLTAMSVSGFIEAWTELIVEASTFFSSLGFE
jgi:hypothetical protein